MFGQICREKPNNGNHTLKSQVCWLTEENISGLQKKKKKLCDSFTDNVVIYRNKLGKEL